MDAYKFAGVVSNEHLRKLKGSLYIQAREQSSSLEAAKDAALKAEKTAVEARKAAAVAVQAAAPQPEQDEALRVAQAATLESKRVKMESDAADKLLQQTLEKLHLHQEPWMLHANLARDVRF